MTELRLVGGFVARQGSGPRADTSQLEGLSTPAPLAACEHRSVSKDGRIVCGKIVDGDPEVSPSICRACPFKAINCAHLRFSLRLHRPTPLVVRFNGRTEVWDDGPPQLTLARAACTERVVPIHGPSSCVSCPFRLPLRDTAHVAQTKRPAIAVGKVVSFPAREAVAAGA